MLGQKRVHTACRYQMPNQRRGIQQLAVIPGFALHPKIIDQDPWNAGTNTQELFRTLLAGHQLRLEHHMTVAVVVGVVGLPEQQLRGGAAQLLTRRHTEVSGTAAAAAKSISS